MFKPQSATTLARLGAGLLLIAGPAAAEHYVAGVDPYFDQVAKQMLVVAAAGVTTEMRLEAFEVDKLVTSKERSAVLPIELRAGKSYTFAAACDQDCPRVLLGLYDQQGQLMQTGDEVRGIALVNLRVPRDGRYLVKAVIPTCLKKRCSFGISVLGEVPRLDTADVRQLVQARDSRRAVLVDARPAADYARGHLPGAVSVPVDDPERGLARLPADKSVPLVIYCVDEACEWRKQVTVAATSAGYTNLYVYPEGISGWLKSGFELAGVNTGLSPNGVIGTEKLLEVFEGRHGEYLLVDVRDADAYARGHLPRAISAPLATLADGGLKPATEATADRLLVFYCWYEECGLSTEAATRARAAGYRNVVAYVAGVKGWVAAGLRLEREETEQEDAPTAKAPATASLWRPI